VVRLAKVKVVLEGKYIRDSQGWTSYHRIDGTFIENWLRKRLENAHRTTTHMRITVETFEELNEGN